MVFKNHFRVIGERREDDGTTCGKKVLIDENGNRWVESNYSKEDAPTGVTVGTLRGNEIIT